MTGRVNIHKIIAGWPEMTRVAGSIKTGWTTASLLISKLQANPQRNRLTQNLQEYGKQLNKGEKIHELRWFLLFGGDSKIRKKYKEQQQDMAGCLNLVSNVIIAWNTVKMQEVEMELKRQGYKILDEDLACISPARHGHLNRYGKYDFNMDLLGR